MSETLEQIVEALSGRVEGADMPGSAKFAIEGLGAVVMDGSGVRIADDDADVTLNADMETFQAIFSGEMNPTSAFMTGKLSIDGDMGLAMKLASVLA